MDREREGRREGDGQGDKTLIDWLQENNEYYVYLSTLIWQWESHQWTGERKRVSEN